MTPLQWDFAQQIKHNRDGSFSTQANRSHTLDLAARELRELGYNNLRAANLKQRHISALVKHWQHNGRTAATIKNRMSHLRWSLEKLGKPGVAGLTNEQLGIEKRQYVAKLSKSIQLKSENLSLVGDQHIRMSLRLQQAFGLRREEALKIQPAFADRGDQLFLKASWAKGGRARSVPIRNIQQRQLLEEAQQMVGVGSMIPPNRSYVEQLRIYESQTVAAGICKAHGLRHHYAQQRYLELTGTQCPAVYATMFAYLDACTATFDFDTNAFPPPSIPEILAGQTPLALDDKQARLLISAELGHSREQITAIYLGR